MTEAVQQLLKSFNALTDEEKQAAVAEILRQLIEPIPTVLSDIEGGQEDLTDGLEFTEEGLRDALQSMGRAARRASFAAGQPVMVIKGGSLLALHADGTEEVVESLPPETTSTGEPE